MFRKYILPALALAGVALGIFAAMRSAKITPPALPVSDAPQPPYQTFVAGAGIVEASTENIAIGTHIPGIVSKIFIQIGGCVKAGNPLFTIDDRAQRALVAARQAAVQVTEAQLADAKYELHLSETLAAQSTTKPLDHRVVPFNALPRHGSHSSVPRRGKPRHGRRQA